MKLRQNASELFNGSGKLFDLLEKSCPVKMRAYWYLYHAKCLNSVMHLYLKLKRGELFITAVYFPHFYIPKCLKWAERKKGEETEGSIRWGRGANRVGVHLIAKFIFVSFLYKLLFIYYVYVILFLKCFKCFFSLLLGGMAALVRCRGNVYY
jgi:hypothetical protein